MLTRCGNGTRSAAAVEERVRQLVADTVGFRAEEGALLDAALDSLTLMGVVTRLEAAFGIELESAEVMELLGARGVHAIVALVTRNVLAAEAKLDESTGN